MAELKNQAHPSEAGRHSPSEVLAMQQDSGLSIRIGAPAGGKLATSSAGPSKHSIRLLAQVTMVNPEYADEPEDGPLAEQNSEPSSQIVAEGSLNRGAELPSEALGLTQTNRVRLLDLVEPSMYDEDRPGAVRVVEVDDSRLAQTIENAGASNLVPLATLGASSWAAIGASAAGVVAGTAVAGGASGGSSSSSPSAAAGGSGIAPVSGDNFINANEASSAIIIKGRGAGAGAQISASIKQLQADGSTVVREIVAAEVLINSDGSWQLPINTVADLSDGTYSLTVFTLDAQGNRSESIQTFVVDKAPPAAPSVNPINIGTSGGTGSGTGSGTTGGATGGTSNTTSDTTPTVSGSGATPGDKIRVLSPTGEILETLAAADGSWSVTPSIELAAGGPRSFTITASDAAGNTSSPTFLPVSVAVPLSLTAGLTFSSDSGSPGDLITNVTRPTLSGSGKPGASIQVTTSAGETATTVVAADGSWSVTVNTPLGDGGPQKISVRSIEINGTTTSVSVPIIVDTVAPSKVVAAISASSDSGIQGDAITNDSTPTIAGTQAGPGDNIRVNSPTGEVMQAVVGLDGRWSVTPSAPLPNAGGQEFRINVSDMAGNPGPATSLFIDVDSSAPPAPSAILDPAYANGSTLAGHTRTSMPTISGFHASADTTISVSSPTGEVMIVKPQADGSWCVTTTIELPPGGPHLFTVTATDLAGNISPATTVQVIVENSWSWQSSPRLDFAVVNDTLVLAAAHASGGETSLGASALEPLAATTVNWPASSTLLPPIDSTHPII